MALETVEPTGPEWCYAAHFESSEKRTHYIEVARDLRHFGIERHQLTKPSEAPYRLWFEYEGIQYDNFFDALRARGPAR